MIKNASVVDRILRFSNLATLLLD